VLAIAFDGYCFPPDSEEYISASGDDETSTAEVV